MREKAKYFFVCVVVLGFCTVGSNGQSRSTISGFVFDTNRTPVGQIPVELLNEVNRVVARTRTDGAGRFHFAGVGHGRFTIRALPLGTNLVEQSAEVEIAGTGVRG